ncbi:MAG TPA: SPFH domain-containing protein, partial [Coriobacteriia bacterium]
MALKDLKDAFFDEAGKQFIARPDETKNQALYKWPNRNIRIASQLTVQPDEFAYFVKKGEIVGYLPNGQYNLDGADIPFIGRLIDRVTEGNFLMSELYFVSTRDFPNNRFGGSMGQVADPDTKLAVSMGVHGQFAFEIFDAGKLIMNFIGTQGIQTNDEIIAALREQILKHARSILNGQIRSQQWDVTRITDGSVNVEFEPAIVAEVNGDIDSYGMRVTKLQDFIAQITDESWSTYQEITKRRANMQLAADPTWGTMAQGELMLGAAQGLKSGTGGAGGTAGTLAGAG